MGLHRFCTGRPLAAVLLVTLGAVTGPAVARAQDVSDDATRAGQVAEQQAEKAKDLKPYEPNRVEQIFVRWRKGVIESPSGFYPILDSVYSGGSFTLGAGYRQYFGDRSSWHVEGMYSILNYKLIDVGFSSPKHAAERVDYKFNAGWRDATQVDYYGLGMDSSKDDGAAYRMKQTYATGLVSARVTGPLALSGGVSFEDYDIGDPQGDNPPVEDVFDPSSAPGLGANPTYVKAIGTAAIDWRPALGYSRTGGYYGATLSAWFDQDDANSFEQLDVNLIQHIPILKETWVVSVRGRMQTILDDDDVAPYFLLPSLGSGSTLRAYSSFRFRDRHSILATGELRWFPNRLGLDMAIFYDAGKVTSRRSDLDFDGLEYNWGIGARFHTLTMTPLRVELAKGSEGWNLVFSGKAAF